MFISDHSQTLIPAQVKQGGQNFVFWFGSAIGPETHSEFPEWALKQEHNVYM